MGQDSSVNSHVNSHHVRGPFFGDGDRAKQGSPQSVCELGQIRCKGVPSRHLPNRRVSTLCVGVHEFKFGGESAEGAIS